MLSSAVLGQILVVADGAQPIADTLTRVGYQVIVARDGQQAMTVAGQIKCDTALVDLDSTEMSGMEIVRRLKECAPDLEVITLTTLSGHPESAGVRADLDDPIFQCLCKPIDMALLMHTVQRAVERRELLRENQRLHQAVGALDVASPPQTLMWARSRPRPSVVPAPRRKAKGGADRLRETEVKTIVAALMKTQWNQRHTAELLNISYSALRRRIAKYHLTPSRQILGLVEHA